MTDTDSPITRQPYQERFPGSDYDPTYYDPGEVDEDLHRKRPAETDERTSWGYLGVLGAVFVGLILFALGTEALEDDTVLPEVVVDETGVSVAATPVRLSVEVENDIVILRGSVPDEAARAQLVGEVEQIYSSANVVDELQIDPNSTLDGGSIAVSGVAEADDDRPAQLRDAVVDAFGLEDGGVTVERTEEGALPAVSVDGVLENGSLRLSGGVPDQASIDDLTAAAQAAFGAVDATGLTVDERTWTEGAIRITGTAPPGSDGADTFVAEVQDRFGTLVSVDVSGISTDTSADTLGAIEAEIQELVTANPILFAPQSSDLDPSSDAVLTEIAAKLADIPQIQVEIVGHTDDLGPDDENLALSQDRADAVLARLVELGVDETRLNATGQGEQSPLVPNDSDENRELNRRIEFNLVAG